MTTQIPTRSKREAMDWSLVLVSQGIESIIDFTEESGWALTIPEHESQRARAILQQYRFENRQWPWRQQISREGALFDWGSVAWVILISFFFWIQTHSVPDLEAAGMMDSAAVSRGEWWRLFTAIFLHADIAHLAMNATIGLVLLGLTMGNLGTGVGLLAAYLAGVGGNLATWLFYSEGHRSLGASGMVMGCVALLAAQSISVGPGANPHAAKYALSGLAGGIMLFVLFGLNPESDVLAHLGGFVSGLVLGILLRFVQRIFKNGIVNLAAGFLFCLLVIFPWWLALSRYAGK